MRPINLAPNTTIRVPEQGYRFGTGPLTLTITEVVASEVADGKVWVRLKGREIRPDWSVAPRERFAEVRLDLVTEIEPVRVR
ncbi:hypothetical protein [Micromonospora sp. NPDC126480]|uniref:hypothetical protein n=1 Tax=Micromonospora sp. NPDC126480 TaxID=3155312 RepID=UPI0033277114